MRVISVSYMALLNDYKLNEKASDDAKEIHWFNINELLLEIKDGKIQLAFDHQKIFQVAIERLRGKIDYSDIVFQLLPDVTKVENSQKTIDHKMVYKTHNGDKDMAYINIAPRIRMTVLYNLAQTHNLLVAGTSNASEIITGYFTKWGDGAADVEPIKEYTKSEVRIIAKYLGVPQKIINKAPSADLWEGQTDEEEIRLTYKEIDEYIICGTVSEEVDAIIENIKKKTEHKRTLLI